VVCSIGSKSKGDYLFKKYDDADFDEKDLVTSRKEKSKLWREKSRKQEPLVCLFKQKSNRYKVIINIEPVWFDLEFDDEVDAVLTHLIVGTHYGSFGDAEWSEYDIGCSYVGSMRYSVSNLSEKSAKLIYRKVKPIVEDPNNWKLRHNTNIENKHGFEKLPENVKNALRPSKKVISGDESEFKQVEVTFQMDKPCFEMIMEHLEERNELMEKDGLDDELGFKEFIQNSATLSIGDWIQRTKRKRSEVDNDY